MTKPSFHLRLIVVVVLIVLAATGAYVFTASNNVPATNAGSGSAVISGYDVTNVAYHLNTGNPSNIDTVTFNISPASATTVKLKLFAAGPWYDCTNTTGSVSCDTTIGTQATVLPAVQLTVVATD
jgi:hypothetical protein